MDQEQLLRLRSRKSIKRKIKSVDVGYSDGSSRTFTPDEWFLYRKQIIENLHKKGLTQIEITPKISAR